MDESTGLENDFGIPTREKVEDYVAAFFGDTNENAFVIPTRKEVEDYFAVLCGDAAERFASGLTYRFYGYCEYWKWTVKYGNKRQPMKDWKGACRTWMRNMKKYDARTYVQMESAKIFNKNNI